MSVYLSLFTVAIPVNYTGEFRELFEAATYRQINSCVYVGGFRTLVTVPRIKYKCVYIVQDFSLKALVWSYVRYLKMLKNILDK
jgi:hypothetical protein